MYETNRTPSPTTRAFGATLYRKSGGDEEDSWAIGIGDLIGTIPYVFVFDIDLLDIQSLLINSESVSLSLPLLI